MTAHLFVVRGAASPDLPLRILNLFAQQDLAYERVAIARDADLYTLSVEHLGLPPATADIIAEKIAAMVLVDSVMLRALPDVSDQ